MSRPSRRRTASTPHVSWNARRVRDDGQEERFVTQRCRGIGRATAERRLAALLHDLHTAALHVCEVGREYVLHDDDLGLDDGWITQEHAR